MSGSVKVRTCLWFESRGEEAAAFYVSLLPDSHIETRMPDREDEPPLVVEFRLAGVPYMVINGGPHYPQTPAASIAVATEDQAETDRLWEALTADGGEPGHCGWLKDRFGVSWQVVPRALIRMMGDKDQDAVARAQNAMMQMGKIDIAALESAFAGNS